MNEFTEMVYKLVKDPQTIKNDMPPSGYGLMHGALGVAGEAGEIVDCIKKHVVYNQSLNCDNLIEELGDIEFFLEYIRQLTHITRESTLRANIAKLKTRYANLEYSDQQAKDRADKK